MSMLTTIAKYEAHKLERTIFQRSVRSLQSLERRATGNVLSKLIPRPELFVKKVEPKFCEDVVTRISKMDDELPKDTLRGIVKELEVFPFTQAYAMLENVAINPSTDLISDKQQRMKTLIKLGESIQKDYDLRSLFEMSDDTEYSFNLVKPGQSPRDLQKALANIGLCWIDYGNDDGAVQRNNADWLQKDTDLGGCIQVIGKDTEWPAKSYLRNFIVNTKKGKMLYIDALESGSVEWEDAEDWRAAGRQTELMYLFASSIYLARQLGIANVALGERETEDYGIIAGITEEKLFTTKNKRKIGYQSKFGVGPVQYRLSDAWKRPVIDVEALLPPMPRELEISTAGVEDFLNTRSKKLQRNKGKTQELFYFLRSMKGISNNYHNAPQLTSRIDELGLEVANIIATYHS